jgi:hypothetical protein
MSRVIRIAAAALLSAGATIAYAGDIGINVAINGEITPGVYGRVELGNRPPPPVVYAQPVVIEQPPPSVHVEPIYLHVPPGHAKNWRKHCHEYHACNRPVYFVKSREYEPGYRPGDDHGHDHDHDRHDYDDHDHDHGHGHGHDRHDHDDHGHHDND